jgi:hypothetical protein
MDRKPFRRGESLGPNPLNTSEVTRTFEKADGRDMRGPAIYLRKSGFYFGRTASAVPWMKAWIFTTSASVSLPEKSGMPLPV